MSDGNRTGEPRGSAGTGAALTDPTRARNARSHTTEILNNFQH